MTDQAREPAEQDPKEAIRTIIEATVSASGEPDQATLPHLVRSQLSGRDVSDAEVDRYVREVLEEMRNTQGETGN